MTAKAIPLHIPHINVDPGAGWDIRPKYKFVRHIGSGAYGSVCAALAVSTHTSVAIKRFRCIFSDPSKCKRALREVELLFAMRHPYIVRAYDVFMRQGSDLYLVMELGQLDLANLRRTTFLVDTQIRILMYRLIVALNYIHSGGILHRDIKPANILTDADCTVKLCDFGLSRGINGTGPECCKTSAGSEISLEDDESLREMDEGITEAPKTVHCKFEVNFERSSNKKLGAGEKSIALLELKEKEQRDIILMASKEFSDEGQLSGHVATRWYRAPEIILLKKHYDSSVDMWGAGCVLAELLEMTKENQPTIDRRLPLFPGHSCFPLSPSQEGNVSEVPVTPHDQLNVILSTLGEASAEDVGFLKNYQAEVYVHMLSNSKKKVNFAERFPAADANAVDLLSRLLAFNPAQRIKAQEALEHTFFQKVRDKKQEMVMKCPVTLVTDTETELSLQALANKVLGKVLGSKCGVRSC
eukprot:TRINITY_DN2067_c0_g3_i14.p1 TRINITY_DN2067_c0_g3~~TRINITY_DN2067_c0_g3_i14.p1  ORF type:complete len:470 (-),score=87.55 TRINITY_DN2067_c0_g3_i14:170-1579(-)